MRVAADAGISQPATVCVRIEAHRERAVGNSVDTPALAAVVQMALSETTTPDDSRIRHHLCTVEWEGVPPGY
jgi:hypothetical protein